MKIKGFIEVTSIYDGKKALIRTACIDSLIDNEAVVLDFGVKPPHRTLIYSGTKFDCIETYDDICSMICQEEL